MCILIHQPKDGFFSSEQLQDFYSKNRDGFGAIVNRGNEVKIVKMVGTLQQIEDLYYKEVACHEAVIHFRMQTHGDIDLENCHPYEVTPGIWMAHNGILSTGNAADTKMSDTWHYINDYLKPLLTAHPELLYQEAFLKLIGNHIGRSNKFALMNQQGECFIINRDSGIDHEGMWYSNTYAWTPWKFGYGTPPAPVSYPKYDHSKFATSPTWRQWDAIERDQQQLSLDYKGNIKPKVKAKPKKKAKVAAEMGRLTSAQLKRLIRSSYNSLMLEDYDGVLRWSQQHPMKASHFIYELLGDEKNKHYTSEAICDKVANDPDWAAETIIDLWVDMEDVLMDLGGITQPKTKEATA